MMMGPGGNLNNYTAAAYQQMLSLGLAANYTAQQAALSQNRNPYAQPAAFAGIFPSGLNHCFLCINQACMCIVLYRV